MGAEKHVGGDDERTGPRSADSGSALFPSSSAFPSMHPGLWHRWVEPTSLRSG